MQLALVLQTSVKLELSRVAIVLLVLTSGLLLASSEPLSNVLLSNVSVLRTNKEADLDSFAAGAEGLPAARTSQHLSASTTAEPPPDTTLKGSGHTGPRVCAASELFQQLVTPAVDWCPADGAVESAQGKQSKPASSSRLLCGDIKPAA